MNWVFQSFPILDFLANRICLLHIYVRDIYGPFSFDIRVTRISRSRGSNIVIYSEYATMISFCKYKFFEITFWGFGQRCKEPQGKTTKYGTCWFNFLAYVYTDLIFFARFSISLECNVVVGLAGMSRGTLQKSLAPGTNFLIINSMLLSIL